MPQKTFDCYTCKHRGTVPGDAHSCCKYPGLDANPFKFFDEKNSKIAQKLQIQGDPHGVRRGWFFWPCNFDPVWLRNCNGYHKETK
jgi:hypothetical protein